MIYLLRDSSHGNAVTVIDRITDACITKTSGNPHGMTCLQKDGEGLSWYAERLGQPTEELLKNAWFLKNYARLDIRKFRGKKIPYKAPFLKNYPYLERCAEHYIATWPKTEAAPAHGDLTLDNVIFTSAGPRFFDWEHFTTQPHPWGFDILYCMLSALLLPLEKDKLPATEDCEKFIDLLFTLLEHGLPASLAEYPLSQYRKIFKTQTCWKEITEKSPHKLFPLRYDELYADIVDDQITRRIRHRRYDNFKKAAQTGKS